MKINFPQLSAFVFAIAISWFALFMTTGCDVTKKQTKHFKKFMKYGGKINCDNDTITYRDTMWLDGKPVIKEVKLPCDCGTPEIGYTNKQVRMMLRHAKDSMDYLIKIEKIRANKLQDSLSKVIKVEKQDTKQAKQTSKQVDDIEDTKQAEANSWVNLAIFLFGALVVVYLLIRQLKKI